MSITNQAIVKPMVGRYKMVLDEMRTYRSSPKRVQNNYTVSNQFEEQVVLRLTEMRN